jgi:hypothetical protein
MSDVPSALQKPYLDFPISTFALSFSLVLSLSFSRNASGGRPALRESSRLTSERRKGREGRSFSGEDALVLPLRRISRQNRDLPFELTKRKVIGHFETLFNHNVLMRKHCVLSPQLVHTRVHRPV